MKGYDEPEILRSQLSRFGPISADAGQDAVAPEINLPPLSARQLRLGLIAAGISITSVDAAMAAIEDPTDRETALVEWEYASQFERNHHLVEMIGTALGMTVGQIDAAWLAAANL